jgi:DNA-directed RNA polymerase subunit RPC12/RpoP
MTIAYRCKTCEAEFALDLPEPKFSVNCEYCGNQAIRTFGGISSDKESDLVSSAISRMMVAPLPSGKDRAVV